MKKMTNKEFKKIFEEAGFDFEIWGYEGILNMIAIAERKQATDAEMRGAVVMPKEHRRRADFINDVLRERGYYND